MGRRRRAMGSVTAPLRAARARAGFPSPAEDYLEGEVDLERTITAGRRGVRLVDLDDPVGITPRLVLAVDPGLRPRAGDVLLAVADGERILARLRAEAGGTALVGLRGHPLRASEIVAEGVVTWSLRGFRPGPPRGPGFRFLVPDGPSSFLFAVDGASMRAAGIRDGDVLVVDRALVPRHGDVVVASVSGGRTVKRFVDDGGAPRLAFDDGDAPRFLPLEPEDTVFGVVAWCLHRLRAPAAPRATGTRARRR